MQSTPSKSDSSKKEKKTKKSSSKAESVEQQEDTGLSGQSQVKSEMETGETNPIDPVKEANEATTPDVSKQEIYCLKVLIAYPNYKRPFANMIVEHFADEASAQKRLRKMKLKYIKSHEITRELAGLSSSDDEEEEEDDNDDEDDDEDEHDDDDESLDLVTVEEFDMMVKDQRPHDIIYEQACFYMDQEPFESEIFKVTC